MKIKKTIYILLLMFSMVTVFSCSHENKKDNNIKNNNIIDKNLITSKKDLIHTSHMQSILQMLYKNNIIYFDFNTFHINANFFKSLDNIADFLCQNKTVTICIEGHTDESGSNKYNLILSQKRAKEIKLYLVKKGVLDKQISFLFYGKQKPMIDCNTELCYAKNRRAVIIFNSIIY